MQVGCPLRFRSRGARGRVAARQEDPLRSKVSRTMLGTRWQTRRFWLASVVVAAIASALLAAGCRTVYLEQETPPGDPLPPVRPVCE